MLTPISIAERALGITAGIAKTGVRAAGQFVSLGRGGDQSAGHAGDSPAGAQRPSRPKPHITDSVLARKVESELFRDPAVPKGKIDVDAVGRVVYLRGKAASAAQLAELERRAQAIPEVDRVENLLGLARPRSRPGAAKQASVKARRRTPSRRVNAETQPTAGEPSPRDLAASGSGRRPAPMGSTDKTSASSAEPSPKDLAAEGTGRKPAPMGSAAAAAADDGG